jgi:hypothetical protein
VRYFPKENSMSESEPVPKSCGPTQLLTGTPNNEWFPEQLSTYAQLQYQQILDGEMHLSRPYWRLGNALELARKSFGRGQWQQYLQSMQIDKTRAAKSRAIYRTFAAEEDVGRLTVEQAYAQRQRNRAAKSESPSPDATPAKKSAQNLRNSVTKIADRTGTVVHDAAFATPGEAVILIPAVRKAIRELQTLLEYLERQAAAGTESL